MDVDGTESAREDFQIFQDFVMQHPKGKTKIVLGKDSHIYFLHEVLQAHERILDEFIISEHDKQWKAKRRIVRPSFIVPIRYWMSAYEKSNASNSSFQGISPADGIPVPERTARQGTEQSERAESSTPGSEKLDRCAMCGKTNVKLSVCSGCKLVKYCTRKCQATDWQSHKQTCRRTGACRC